MNRRSERVPGSMYTTEARKRSAWCSLAFVASVLIMVGFFGPWVAHRTAALTVTGYELSEFAKFFPQVQSGTVPVRRGLFITPLLASAISMALIINRSTKGIVWRLAATALIAVIAASTLPPFQAILAAEYRLQLILVTACVLLTMSTALTRRLSEHSRGALLAALAAGGAAPALWQARLLHPLVSQLYGSAVRPGWGVVVCGIGFVALLLTAARRTVRS